jgi:hypothetical protein
MVKAPDYYIVCDIDDKMLKLNTDTFLTCWDYDFDWSMMGANQYDMWALRTLDDWCDYDTHDKIPGQMSVCPLKSFSVKSEPIRVKSCFGGTGVYKYPFTKGVVTNPINK